MMATHFSSLDWVIVIVYLAATMATGLYGRKFVGGITDFLVAGRELGTFLAVATLAATEIGTITYNPVAQFAGTDTFTYSFRDKFGVQSNTATVTAPDNTVASATDGPDTIGLFRDGFD